MASEAVSCREQAAKRGMEATVACDSKDWRCVADGLPRRFRGCCFLALRVGELVTEPLPECEILRARAPATEEDAGEEAASPSPASLSESDPWNTMGLATAFCARPTWLVWDLCLAAAALLCVCFGEGAGGAALDAAPSDSPSLADISAGLSHTVSSVKSL